MCHVGCASKRGGLAALEGKVEPIEAGMHRREDMHIGSLLVGPRAFVSRLRRVAQRSLAFRAAPHAH